MTESNVVKLKSNQDDRQEVRPSKLADFIGQKAAKQILEAMMRTGRLSDSLLFIGPPGIGKTTLARIASGSGRFTESIGSHLSGPEDMVTLLAHFNEKDHVVFIDEIHAAKRRVLEILYGAMEDGIVRLPTGGSFPLAEGRQIIAATTDAGKLPQPLRDRFGQTIYLTYYNNDEITEILTRSASVIGLHLSTDQVQDIARRSRGTPRIANRILRRIKDFSTNGVVDLEVVWQALGIDAMGLEEIDRRAISLLTNTQGSSVSLDSLAKQLGVDSHTVENVIEPYLIRENIIEINTKGRRIKMDYWIKMAQEQAK